MDDGRNVNSEKTTVDAPQLTVSSECLNWIKENSEWVKENINDIRFQVMGITFDRVMPLLLPPDDTPVVIKRSRHVPTEKIIAETKQKEAQWEAVGEKSYVPSYETSDFIIQRFVADDRSFVMEIIEKKKEEYRLKILRKGIALDNPHDNIACTKDGCFVFDVLSSYLSQTIQ